MNTGISKELKGLFRFGIWSELSNVFRMFAEIILIVLWSYALSLGSISWAKSLLIFSTIYFFSHLIARYLHHLKFKVIFQRIFYFLWILCSLTLSFNLLFFKPNDLTIKIIWPQIFQQELSPMIVIGFWVLLFSVIAILRGVQLARYPVNAREQAVGLRFSLVIFLVFAVLFAKSGYSIFLPLFFLFFFFYLLSLSLARISDLSDSFGSRIPGFNNQWAAGISLTSLAILLVAFILTLILNINVAQFLGKGLQLIVQLGIGALVLITSPILLALVAVLQFLFELLAPNLGNMLSNAELETGDQLLQDFQDQVTEATKLDPRLFIMIGVLALLIIAAMWQLKWKPWQREGRAEDGISETSGSFRIKNPLKNLFPTLGRRRKRASARSLIAAARIRRVYAQLMDLCEQMGKPRPRSLTPNEFLTRMYQLFPENISDLEIITEAYIKVRYGELPETSKDVAEVFDSWERVNTYGKGFVEERTKHLRQRNRFR